MAKKNNLPPILIPNGEVIPEQGRTQPRYKMINFKRNVRVDLSDREIRVPKERSKNHGFREVRGGQALIGDDLRALHNQNEDIWKIGFMVSAIVAVVFMVLSIISIFNGTGSNEIAIIGATISSISAFIFSMITNGYRSWQSWLWAFNATLWTIQVFML